MSLSACADRRRRPVLVEPLESRVLFAGIPQYPDLAPWVSQQRGYLYGWTIDTNQIPGRTLLRLSNAAINMGAGPMEINGGAVNPDGSQQVFQRVYASDGSSKQFLAGSFIYHAQHTHVHFEDFTQYNLRFATPDDGSGEAGAGELAATSDKVSFCLLDSVAYNTSLPGAPLTAQNVSCSNVKQGISVGWADLYDKSLYGQWIDVTDVASGRYWLEVVIDPMNRLAEANEFNNMARIMIDLHQGDGTLAGAFDVGVLVGGGAAETQAFHEFVGTMDTLDYYKFTVSSAGTVSLSLNELRAGSNADLYLLDSSGATLASSVRSGTNAESISRTVAPGTYYVLADQVSGDSTYTLGMTFTPTAGASEGSGADAGGGVAGDGSPTTPTRPGNGHGGWIMHGNDTRQSPAEQLFGDDEATRLLE